jgi:uncharacterized membrane protein YphA (DoxX/SURF4 family)
VVLVVAGWIKISNPDDAVRAVQAYQILPQGLTHAFGYGLPLVEILLGMLLVLGLGTRWAAVGAGVLMLVFIGGIVSVWVRGLSIDCGCFGGGGTTTAAGRNARYSTEIGRDVLFIALAAWTARWPVSRLAVDGLLRAPALFSDGSAFPQDTDDPDNTVDPDATDDTDDDPADGADSAVGAVAHDRRDPSDGGDQARALPSDRGAGVGGGAAAPAPRAWDDGSAEPQASVTPEENHA